VSTDTVVLPTPSHFDNSSEDPCECEAQASPGEQNTTQDDKDGHTRKQSGHGGDGGCGESEPSQNKGHVTHKSPPPREIYAELTREAPLDVEVLPDELEQRRRRPARWPLYVLAPSESRGPRTISAATGVMTDERNTGAGGVGEGGVRLESSGHIDLVRTPRTTEARAPFSAAICEKIWYLRANTRVGKQSK